MFDSYMSFLVGAALVYNTSYRSLELVFTKNHGGASVSHVCCVACVVADPHPLEVIAFLALSSLASAGFCFYVATAVPAVDAMAGLSKHTAEASTLCLMSTVLVSCKSLVVVSSCCAQSNLSSFVLYKVRDCRMHRDIFKTVEFKQNRIKIN